MTTAVVIELSVEERVSKGVSLLDERLPDWWARMARVDMAYSNSCVLGQLKKSYKAGLEWLGIDHGYSHGFGIIPQIGMPPAMDQYRELTSLWRHHINDRMRASKAPDLTKEGNANGKRRGRASN